MVGFNRRFSPAARALGVLRALRGPGQISHTLQRSAIPAEHWTQDEAAGGRIIGEPATPSTRTFLAGRRRCGSTRNRSAGRKRSAVTDDQWLITLRTPTLGLQRRLPAGAIRPCRRSAWRSRRRAVRSSTTSARSDAHAGKTKRSRRLGQDKGHARVGPSPCSRGGGDAPIPWAELRAAPWLDPGRPQPSRGVPLEVPGFAEWASTRRSVDVMISRPWCPPADDEGATDREVQRNDGV